MDLCGTDTQNTGPKGVTEQLVLGEGVKDARRSDHGAHGGRQSAAVDPDGHKRRPNVDPLEEAVVLSHQIPSHNKGEKDCIVMCV